MDDTSECLMYKNFERKQNEDQAWMLWIRMKLSYKLCLKLIVFNTVHYVKFCTIVLHIIENKFKWLAFCFLLRWITCMRIMWFPRPRASLCFHPKRMISNIFKCPDVWRVKLPSVKLSKMSPQRTIPGVYRYLRLSVSNFEHVVFKLLSQCVRAKMNFTRVCLCCPL